MKRLCLPVVLFLAIVFASCAQQAPEQVLREHLDAMEQLDGKKAYKYLSKDYQARMPFNDFYKQNMFDIQLSDQFTLFYIMKHRKYELIDTKQDGLFSDCHVRISTPEMEPIFELTVSDEFQNLSDPQKYKQIEEKYGALISMRRSEWIYQMILEDGKWKLLSIKQVEKS